MQLVEPPEVAGWAVVILGGGADVHHVHLWQMQEHAAALDCHVVLHRDAWDRREDVKTAIKAQLRDRFGIDHSTLEFEHPDIAHAQAAVCGYGTGA